MRAKFLPEGAAEYLDLTPGNIYRIIEIVGDDFRILSDEGLPYLYPERLFEVTDPQEPAEWVTSYAPDGARFSSAPVLREPGFFERYFEGDPDARRKLRKYLSKWRLGEP